jgi:hypothetical protein
MALTKCPDCGNGVSTAAANCPRCGRPMAMFSGKAVQTQRKGGKYEGLGFLLILVGIGTCFVSGPVGSILIFIGFVVFLVGRCM